LKGLKDTVCLAVVVSGAKLADGLGAPTVIPEPVGGPGPGPEAEAKAAAAEEAAAAVATKGGVKKGKKAKNGGAGGASAAATAVASAESSGAAAAAAAVVPPLSEWHLTVTPSQGTSGRQVSFSVLGHGPDDDRTVDLLRQGLAGGGDASSGAHGNTQKGAGKGGKKGGKHNGSGQGGGRGNNHNESGKGAGTAGGQPSSSSLSSSLWTVRCAASDCAVVLSLLELKVPGLAFFVYAHPGHFDVATTPASSSSSGSGKDGNDQQNNGSSAASNAGGAAAGGGGCGLTAPGSSAAIWGKLQASLRARCHHPLKGGGHLRG